MKGVNIFLSN